MAIIDILMPGLSPTMAEGNLARWLKQEGDAVERGEVIAEIETDKSVVEFVAKEAGILGRILVPAGAENVPVDQPIATLITSSADVPQVPTARRPEQIGTRFTARVEPHDRTARVAASPLARRIAREAGVELRELQGSGPGGRIVRADVERLRRNSAAEQGHGEMPVSAIRRAIARRMSEAKASIPHFYLTTDCKVDALLGLRSEMNAGRIGEQHLSVNDFVIRAVALALRRAPAANASWRGQTIRLHDEIDLAVAVAAPNGLITPIIRRASEKSVPMIAEEMAALISRARAGSLTPAEYQGGSFTISNLGMYGIREFAAIINPPQAGILAVGAIEKRVIVERDAPRIAAMMSCTLSADHRVVDGVAGAEFLAAFRTAIEEPALLVKAAGPPDATAAADS